jgi:hypothetical protein
MARGKKGGPIHKDRKHEPPHADPRGRDHRVHVQIILARWRGSVPPTAERYARALAQWRQLPGAVATAATDLGNVAGTPTDEPPASGSGPAGESAP